MPPSDGDYIDLDRLWPLLWIEEDEKCPDCGKPYEYTNAWGTLICPLCWEDS
jgi:hypothetical protein